MILSTVRIKIIQEYVSIICSEILTLCLFIIISILKLFLSFIILFYEKKNLVRQRNGSAADAIIFRIKRTRNILPEIEGMEMKYNYPLL